MLLNIGNTKEREVTMPKVIEIWSPRYHDRVALVAVHKVTEGYCFLRFTKAPHLKGILYRFDGSYVRRECEVQSNGKIPCFVIPMYMLEEVEKNNPDDE